MYKVKRTRTTKRFQSVNGNFLDLYIVQRRLCLNITIQNTNYYVYQKYIPWLLVICLINMFCYILHIIPSQIVIVVSFITMFIIITICRTVKEDNLVIVSGLGIQLSTAYLISSKKIFIPIEKIHKVFINEVLHKRRVIYVLCLLIENKDTKEKLIPLFVATFPRLSCLQVLYCTILKYLNKNENNSKLLDIKNGYKN